MKRPLFWASLGAISGTLAAFFEVRWLVVSVVVLSLLAVTIVLFGRNVSKTVIVLPVGVLIGVLLCLLYLNKEKRCAGALFVMRDIPCVVTEVRTSSFLAMPEETAFSRFRILVYAGESPPEIGDRVTVKGPLQDLPAASNEGEWDAASYYRSHCCIGTASAWSPNGPGELTLRMRIARLRTVVSDRIDLLYPEETASMVKAVLYCEKSGLDEELSERYRELGIAHILAVSGLHVSVFGGFLTVLFLMVMRRPHAEAAAAVVLFGYGALTGFPVSCARAVFTALFSGIGRLCGRTPDRLTGITFTAAVFLLCRPVLLLQQGFLLSFACAYILLRLSGEWEDGQGKTAEEKTADEDSAHVPRAIRMGVRLAFLLLPLQVTLFYTTSPFAPLLNAMVLPLMGLLLPAAALSVMASLAWLLIGRAAAGLPHYGFTLIDAVSRILRKIPFSVVVTGRPCVWNYLAYAVLFACVTLLRRKHGKVALLLSATAFLCFLPVRSSEMRICNLSVGQGDCCVILRGNACVVIDCGSQGKTAVGERILQPFLLYHGFEKPTLIVISHTDTDHISGLTELMQGAWSDVAAVLPSIEKGGVYDTDRNGLRRFLADGDEISVLCGMFADDLVITALHPSAEVFTDSGGTPNKNENSLVVSVTDGEFCALFTGDCGNESLKSIVLRNRQTVAGCDYLKVAHHGSVHSAEPSFYEAIHPAVAVISVGANNYGHPSPVTVEMAEETGAEVYVTRTMGQVTTRFGKGGICVETFFEGTGDLSNISEHP